MSYIAKPPFQAQVDVSDGATVLVDTLDITKFTGLKYTFCVYNKAQNKSKMFDMSVTRQNTSIKESVFGKTGSIIALTVSTTVAAGVFGVEVSNTAGYTLTVEFTRSTFN